MTGPTREEISAVVTPVVAGLGYDLEDVEVRSGGGQPELRIAVDRDGGADLDALADVSRALSDVLDVADLFGEQPYDLQVSTPGVTRPLTLPRHWRRAQGRKVSLTRSVDGADQPLSGRIGVADDESVTLVHNDKGRMSETVIPFAEITRAVLDVDFTRPGPAELRRCGLDDAEIARRREAP